MYVVVLLVIMLVLNIVDFAITDNGAGKLAALIMAILVAFGLFHATEMQDKAKMWDQREIKHSIMKELCDRDKQE